MQVLMQNMEQIEQWMNVYTEGAPKDIQRLKDMLANLGHPELKAPAIHVTGTNGKGSTCRYIEKIARDHGYSTLLFTSPHLVQLSERIRYNQEDVSDRAFIELMNEVRQHVEDLHIPAMTYFEVLTLAYFVHASKVNIDLMIVEVGIGGKTDYTNVLPSAVRVITSIGRDHIPGLGKNEAAITRQKAGIIHQGDRTIIGEMDQAYIDIIQKVVNENEGQLISYKSEVAVQVPQLGFYQVWNAQTALAAFRHFTEVNHLHFDENIAIEAIHETKIPGRLERVVDLPETYIDGAHNISAIQVLVPEIQKSFAEREVIMLFAALTRKDVKESLDYVATFSEIDFHVTGFDYYDARSREDYLEDTDAHFVENWYDYYMEVAHNKPEAVFIFCGSFYFISEVREKLQSGDIYENISNF